MVTSDAPRTTHQRVPRCPRCRGRLLVEQDHYGDYLNCFTCGFARDALQGGTLTEPEATAGADTGVARHGAPWRQFGSTAAAAPPAQPYLAPPVRRCSQCDVRAWAWHALGPARGAWRCTYCGGDRPHRQA